MKHWIAYTLIKPMEAVIHIKTQKAIHHELQLHTTKQCQVKLMEGTMTHCIMGHAKLFTCHCIRCCTTLVLHSPRKTAVSSGNRN
jgi:hypothetical protein